MQVQTNRSRLVPSRNFPYLCIHSGTDRFVRRYPHPKTHGDVVPFPYVRVAPGHWFQIPGVCAPQGHTATTPGSEHPVAGMKINSRQPGTGRTIIAGCSPPMNCTSSTPYSSVPAMPPPRPLKKRSLLAMSSSSDPVPTRTGKLLSCWFAGFVQMARSAARSCGRIVAATLLPGTRTARRQSSKSGVCPSMNPRCASAHGATTGLLRVYIILSAKRLDARRERPLEKQLSRQGVGSLAIRYRKWHPTPITNIMLRQCRSP